VYNYNQVNKKANIWCLNLRRIGNRVKILNEPITVRAEQTTITTVFLMGRCGMRWSPSQETCLCIGYVWMKVKFMAII